MMKARIAIHGLLIAHRDVKPDNFQSSNGDVKLCDFGFATAVPGEDISVIGVYGTAPFMSPEMWNSMRSKTPHQK